MLRLSTSKNIFTLIEFNNDYSSTFLKNVKQALSNVSIATVNSNTCLFLCDKLDFLNMLNLINFDELNGAFFACINDDVLSGKPIHNIERKVGSLVKKREADISISFNFPEKEMIISFRKDKHHVNVIKDVLEEVISELE